MNKIDKIKKIAKDKNLNVENLIYNLPDLEQVQIFDNGTIKISHHFDYIKNKWIFKDYFCMTWKIEDFAF